MELPGKMDCKFLVSVKKGFRDGNAGESLTENIYLSKR
jgi:hypothetical protein